MVATRALQDNILPIYESMPLVPLSSHFFFFFNFFFFFFFFYHFSVFLFHVLKYITQGSASTIAVMSPTKSCILMTNFCCDKRYHYGEFLRLRWCSKVGP